MGTFGVPPRLSLTSRAAISVGPSPWTTLVERTTLSQRRPNYRDYYLYYIIIVAIITRGIRKWTMLNNLKQLKLTMVNLL